MNRYTAHAAPQIVRMEIEFEASGECVGWNVFCATNWNYYIKLR